MNTEEIAILHEAADLLAEFAGMLADSHIDGNGDWDNDEDRETWERMTQVGERLRAIAEAEA